MQSEDCIPGGKYNNNNINKGREVKQITQALLFEMEGYSG